MHFQQSIKSQPASSGTVDLLGGAISAPTSSLAQSTTTAANDDDEWTFSSAVPAMSNEIVLNDNSDCIKVVFKISRESDTVLLIHNKISNKTDEPILNLTVQVAASRVCLSYLEELFDR